MAPSRQRLLEAGYACIARYGIAKTTIDDVAREASMSRATVYRYFPGGKEQLVGDVIAWEAERFFLNLTTAVADRHGLAARLEAALVFAHQAIEDHAVLQKILDAEPERLMPALTVESAHLLDMIKALLRPELGTIQLAEGIDSERAADWIARMFLSHIGAQGSWDLTDPDAVAELVETQLLAGVIANT